ncbi:MAG: hypothetical protein SOH80_07025 [Eubacteriales bacterium]
MEVFKKEIILTAAYPHSIIKMHLNSAAKRETMIFCQKLPFTIQIRSVAHFILCETKIIREFFYNLQKPLSFLFGHSDFHCITPGQKAIASGSPKQSFTRCAPADTLLIQKRSKYIQHFKLSRMAAFHHSRYIIFTSDFVFKKALIKIHPVPPSVQSVIKT